MPSINQYTYVRMCIAVHIFAHPRATVQRATSKHKD